MSAKHSCKVHDYMNKHSVYTTIKFFCYHTIMRIHNIMHVTKVYIIIIVTQPQLAIGLYLTFFPDKTSVPSSGRGSDKERQVSKHTVS